jgi:hypothetical protein
VTQIDPSRYKRLSRPLDYGVSDGLYWDSTNSEMVVVIDDTVKFKVPLSQTSGHVVTSDGTDMEPVTPADTLTTAMMQDGAVTPAKLSKPRLRCVEETVTAASLTDGGAAVGTKTLTASIPAGARYLFTTATALVGFTGDTSAVIMIGDGTDADRYNTGAPSIFTTAAAGVDLGAASGTAFHSAAKTVAVVVTSAADITPVIAGAGSVNLKFWFLEPI